MTKHIFYHGDVIDCLRKIPEKSINTVVTSPPYWGLRDYDVDGQIGLEKTPEEYVIKLVNVFREVWRVLRDDGTLWLNLGDSYASSGGIAQPHRDGSGGIGKKGTRGMQGYSAAGGGFIKPSAINSGLKPKDLVGIPWRVALALQADGWYLRSDIIWSKPNPMPESVTDRPTKAHEYLFLLAKSQKYYYDHEAIKEPAAWERWGDQTVKKEQQGTAKWIQPKTKAELKAYSFKRKVNENPPPGKPTQHREDREDKAYIGTRNKRTVWTIPTRPFPEAHFATFPPELVRPCILAGSPVGGTVLDPFGGSGTVSMVAMQEGRDSIYIDLNREYLDIALRRCGFDGSKLIFDQYEIKEVKHGSGDNCLHNCATW